MHIAAFFISVSSLLSPGVCAAEPFYFYSQRVAVGLTIRLGIIGSDASAEAEYDHDVQIRILEIQNGGARYLDPSGHKASIRCVAPAVVGVGGVDYPIDTVQLGAQDWKYELWKAVCTDSIS